MTGLTGLIKFDHEGFRSDFKLDIIELTSEGLIKKGTWNTTEGVNFTQTIETEDEANSKMDLRNVTFIVMISMVRPPLSSEYSLYAFEILLVKKFEF